MTESDTVWYRLAREHYLQRVGQELPARSARVIAEHRTEYALFDDEEMLGVVRGTFHRDGGFPKVGDWVAYDPAEEGKVVIEHVLPRFAEIARKASGEDAVQVIAANVDLMLAVQGLDQDFSPRRLERYLVLARQAACEPAILLTKSDLRDEAGTLEALREVRAIDPEVRVITLSVPDGVGIDAVRELLRPGSTAVLVGSSGAGKSTLLNALLGEERQRTREVRAEDGKGRHTTTHRELFPLPGGSTVIDTPGMRELGVLPASETARDEVYAEVAELATACRFADCDHARSAGCRIREAIASGELPEGSFQGYAKMLREEGFRENERRAMLAAFAQKSRKGSRRGGRDEDEERLPA